MQGEWYHYQDNLNSGVKNRRNYCMPLLYTAYQGTAFMFPSWWCSCPGASAWDGGGHRSSRLRHRRGPGCWKLGAEADTEVHQKFWSTTELCSLSQPFSLGFAEPTWKTSEPLGQKIIGRVLDIQETWCGGLAWELGHVFVSLRPSSETWNWIFLQKHGWQQSDTSHFILPPTSWEAFQVSNSKWFLLRCVMWGTSFY